MALGRNDLAECGVRKNVIDLAKETLCFMYRGKHELQIQFCNSTTVGHKLEPLGWVWCGALPMSISVKTMKK